MEIKRRDEAAIDLANLLLASVLILAPWFFNYLDLRTASWNAWITGGAIAIIALAAVFRFAMWEEILNMVLGAWAILAPGPWILGYADRGDALWSQTIIGLLILALAAFELRLVRSGRRGSRRGG